MWQTVQQKGFGLVEVMLAAAMAGGLALTVAKISQDATRASKTTESNTEINAFATDVAFILSSKDNCNSTIATPATIGTSVSAIRRYAGTPPTLRTVYQVNPGGANPIKYGNGTFTIKSMKTEQDSTGSVYLVANIVKESKVILGGKEIIKRIPLKATIDSTDPTKIQSCFTDTDSMIEEAAKAACKGNSAYWDDVAKECRHEVDTSVCPVGQMMTGMTITATGQISKNCVDIISNISSCPTGEYVAAISSTGQRVCRRAIPASACPDGQYVTADGTGQVVCKGTPTSCGSNQVLISNGGSFACRTIMCAANQYFAGIDTSTGSQICKTIPSRDCGSGQYVTRVNPDGSIECGNLPASSMGVAGVNQYIRGYDSATGAVYANTIPTCTGANFLQFNGTSFTCVAPATSTSDDYATICSKFPGFTWNSSTSKCDAPSEASTLVAFAISFNGSSWSISNSYLLFGNNGTQKSVNAVIEATRVHASCHYEFRITFGGYAIDDSEILAHQYNGGSAGETGMKVSFRPPQYLSSPFSGNQINIHKADDSSCNAFVSGDRINFIAMIPRM